MTDAMPSFVVLLLAIPALAAIVSAALGSARLPAIRWICLSATIVDAVLACILAANFCGLDRSSDDFVQVSPATHLDRKIALKPIKERTTFQPEFVPDADPKDKHKTTWHILQFGDVGRIQFYLGVDGLNIWLIVLTTILMVPAVLISWNAIGERGNEYYAWLLALGTGMLGVFLAFDIILFYVFFELTLVPLFFLIGIWGGPERRHAARKFFIYTLAGSLITFLGLLAVIAICYDRSPTTPKRLTFAVPELVDIVNKNLAMEAGEKPKPIPSGASQQQVNLITSQKEKWDFWQSFQFWVFLALATGFAVKVPLVPLHTWLPLAHVEAPTAGSVLLAGVLLKMGTYGFLRFCLPLAPDACITVGVPLIGTLAVVGIVYGAFCALAQSDIKKLVAYSSVSHLGFCMLGMFALNREGLSGSLLQMINHGLSTGGLFLLVGMLYERYHTRQLADYGGLGSRFGMLTVCTVFICLSSIGMPGLNGFVGEILVFLGAYEVRPTLAIVGTLGVLLGAWYLLSMVRQVFFGTLKEPHHEGTVGDLGAREVCILVPIMVLCLALGIYPQPVLNAAKSDIDVVANILEKRTELRR